MPKYYCESGEHKRVLDSKDKISAVERFIRSGLNDGFFLSFLTKISETGFEPIVCCA